MLGFGIEREIPVGESDFLVVSAYRQRIPLNDIDLLQTPYDEIKNGELRGRRSEVRAKVLIATIPFVSDVVWPSWREDRYLKVDLWAKFPKHSGHDSIPVQVKSRQFRVEEFLEGPYAMQRRIIGLNAGPDTTDLEIIKEFRQQLEDFDGFL